MRMRWAPTAVTVDDAYVVVWVFAHLQGQNAQGRYVMTA